MYISDLSGKPYIFISHAHEDKSKAKKIYNALVGLGFPCWMDDREIRAMENFNEEIQNGIEGCTVFLAVFSKNYVFKTYCELEYDCAINHGKSQVIVCIDDVTAYTNPRKKHLFSYFTNLSVAGYGEGVEDDEESILAFCKKFLTSPRFYELRRKLGEEGMETKIPFSMTEELMQRLIQYTRERYHQDGNYVFSAIDAKLFPEIQEKVERTEEDDSGKKKIDHYIDEEQKQVSLVKYLISSEENARKNIFLTGEGGNGKTVSLLQTCEFLLYENRCAVYIPLKELSETVGISEYVHRAIFHRNDAFSDTFEHLLRCGDAERPLVVFLLDGVNEVEGELVRRVMHGISRDFMHEGVQFIISSRSDSRKDMKLKNFSLLELQPLSRPCIEEYLESHGLDSHVDDKLLSVIRTPLLLTLYADTERYRNMYEIVDGIQLVENPNTAGKILSNFFQTQLYRASEEVSFHLGEQLIILEFLLPMMAYRMIEKRQSHLKESEVFSCAKQITQNSPLYRWYSENRLGMDVPDFVNPAGLINYAKTSLHFIREIEQDTEKTPVGRGLGRRRAECSYEFTHQMFRDYFAAYHIANELSAAAHESAYLSKDELAITEHKLSDDVLQLLSDILCEEDAAPVKTDNGWDFPGKDDLEPSQFSLAELMLELWRDEENEAARCAVYNLLNVMKFGRGKCLAWCDFSRLDLRKCQLNGCRFVEWYEDDIYPSSFEGAWIDRACFVNDGHDSSISAVCTDGGSRIFSGNMNGTVKVYDHAQEAWVDSVQMLNDPVVDLAWDAGTQTLAVLYPNGLYRYAAEDRVAEPVVSNPHRSKSYRYVRFNGCGGMELSYDLEPLLWFTTEDAPLPTDLEFDVPARCARWNPVKKEFIRSNLLQLLSVYQYNDEEAGWGLHPVLQERKAEERNKVVEDESFAWRELRVNIASFIQLRADAEQDEDGVSSIVYKDDGSRFLITIQNVLLEYDAHSLQVLHKKAFAGNISSVCYGCGGIVVAVGMNLLVLDEDLSENVRINGTQIRSIRVVVDDYKGEGYYLISDNGEFKKLDLNLTVQRMRRAVHKSAFVWARDRRTGVVQMAFRPNNLHQNGARYTYETGTVEPLGWCYEFLDRPLVDDQRRYTMGTRLMTVESKPPYKKIIYENYAGLCFYGCSFCNVRGNLSEESNRAFISQNGGVYQ